MRILVTGGRDFEDAELLGKILGSLNVTLVVNGAARGADSLSSKWAEENKIPCLMFPALWQKEGKAAGPMRNRRMLDESDPDLVVAFPGGKGTADMVEYAMEKKVPVWDLAEGEQFQIKGEENVGE